MFILFQKQLTKENLKITLLSRNWQLCEFNKIQVTETEPGATDREARETRDITYNSLHTHWLPHSLSSLPLLSFILDNNKFKRSQMQTFDKNFYKLLLLGLLTLTFPAGAIFGPFQSTSMPLISIFRVSFRYVHLPVKIGLRNTRSSQATDNGWLKYLPL